MVMFQKLELSSFEEIDLRCGRFGRLILFINIILLMTHCTNLTDVKRKAGRDNSEKSAATSPKGPEIAEEARHRTKKDPPPLAKAVSGAQASAASRPAPVLAPLDMTFVGDVMFGRYTEEGLARNPDPDVPLFDDVKAILSADIAMANLETPLLRTPYEKCPWPPALRFAAGPWAAAALRSAGFTALSLANNHVYDMRAGGVGDTRALLEENGITAIGAPTEQGVSPFGATTVNTKGWRVALVAVTALSNSLASPGKPALPYIPLNQNVPGVLAPVIEKARADHDLVVIFIHWGVADVDHPAHPRLKASRELIDLGADLVIGHHPHVLQGVEVYGGGLIAHSLGDLLFDKIRNPSRLSGVLRIRYKDGERCPGSVRFHPVILARRDASIIPVRAKGALARSVTARMQKLSRAYKTEWRQAEHSLVLETPVCPRHE
jgi:poly-gamma-glutamate synthesis protein (capsule biosynthesis protein)